MGTLNSNRKGYIQGPSASGYEGAWDGASGTAYDAQSSNAVTAIQYFFSTGRGGGTHRFTRAFIHFDTSGISGGSSFSLVVPSCAGSTASNNNVIAVKHSAGEGTGLELDNADFNNIDRDELTAYSAATSWASSGNVSLSLNATAASDIINNSHFNIAIILNHDYEAEDEGPLEESGNISNGIAFGDTIYLSYTDPTSGYTHKVNTVAAANIGKVNTVATANIGKINTVD